MKSEGFNYHETFAPIAKMTSLRCFLLVAVAKGWDLHQMDVYTAFIHGDLEDEVYMNLTPCFKHLKSLRFVDYESTCTG